MTTETSMDAAEQLAAGAILPLTDVERRIDDAGHSLPVQLTSFVGREAAMTQVRALLAGSRLVTLTGAGGVGKTRLALEVAASLLTDFPAGVWLVDLAPLTDAALVPVTVARALGLLDEKGRSAMATVTGFLGGRRVLVVLDNCEHLLDACAQLAEELLRACPGLVILGTSREPIGAAGEATWLVPSLELASEAVELFADRARRARPRFEVNADNGEAVAEICRRLDGIPLAIELAAARLRAFSPAEIAAALHDRFRLLTGGSRTAVRRQQTLRASVDWSHALLTELEQVVFRRLAAFAGGFDLQAAEVVGAGDGLERHQVLDVLALLVDKSLAAAEESQEQTRYRLPETIRQYAAEKLAESGEAEQVRTRHRDHYTALAAQLDAPANQGRRRLIRHMETEIDNLRAAFAWSLELSDTETALRLASSLEPVWLGRCRMREGLDWFNAALDTEPQRTRAVAPAVWIRAVADAVLLASWAGALLDNWAGGPPVAQAAEAVAVAREHGDPALLGRALLGACIAAGHLTEAGRVYLDEASVLARQAADARALAVILSSEAHMASVSGDPAATRSAAEEGLALAEETANDHLSRLCRHMLSFALTMQGDLHQARSLAGGLVAEADAERFPLWRMQGLWRLGEALAYLGQADEARAAGVECIAIAEDLGMAAASAAEVGYWCLSLAAMASGDRDALRDATVAIEQRMDFENILGAIYHIWMAEADLAAGDLPAARQHADQGIAEGIALGQKWGSMLALLTSSRVAATAGDAGRACDDAHQALTIGRDIESKSGIIDAFECLACILPGTEDHHKAARLLGAADRLRQATGYQRFRLHQADYDATVAGIRAAVGEQAFGLAWDEGAALTCEEAVSYALRGRGERSRPPIGWLSLTPAERDVARLVAEGLATKVIADRLFVSPRTVQTHLTHMYGKLGIKSRVQLAQQAARHA